MGSESVITVIVPPDRVCLCPLCGYPGGGPSDHEAWCRLFMVGPVALEGQRSIFDELGE